MKANTKEEIKDRMIKNAASMWGVAANEIEMSFDPIVSLLIAACASEIEKISGEVDESQTRITEKVIQLMTPETSSGPTPAHAIAHAEPIDEIVQIQPEFLFNYKKEEVYKKTALKFKDISFSPVQSFNLVGANVQYLATGSTIIEFEPNKIRQVLVENIKNSDLLPSTIYLGLSSDLKSIPIEDVSFYFELQSAEDKELFYHHLRNAEWFVNDEKVEVVSGFYNSEDAQNTKLKSYFEDVSNKSINSCEQIINYYASNFITTKSVSDEKGIKKSTFNELQDLIKENKIKIAPSTRWIKIVFPKIITNSILEHVHCSVNAFPVLNRGLNSFSYQIKEYINILPIKTDDLFFDMKSIVNTEGMGYRASGKNNLNEEKGTFAVRTDNIGKLDKRKAREYITHLIELLKDESASFSFMNNDFLQKNLKGLNQLISLLEKKVSEATNEETQTNYVLLKPYGTNENLLVEYWSTNGESANNIKTGSELAIYKGVGVHRKGSYFMTTSYGGKDNLNMKDRLNSYRRSLLSRDRIVTKEDIKAVCYELYGDKVSKVEIKKSYASDIAINRGLVQCIEIELTPNNKNVTGAEEWNSLNNNLLHFLKKKSINVFPYKIKILN